MHSHAAGHSYALSPSHHRAVVELTRSRIVDYIGPVHAGFVTVAPSTPHDVWHGVAWVTDTAAQHAADVAAAEQKKSALRAATDAEIAWLVVPIIGVEPTTFALRISRITFN
jgi:hypothetical protein